MNSHRLLTLLFAGLLFTSAVPARSFELTLTAREDAGFTRRSEPVTTGVILPRGIVSDISALAIVDGSGKPVTAQFEKTASWPDGSVKWLLVDFVANCPSDGTARYTLTDRGTGPPDVSPLKVERDGDGVTVSTGPLRCRLDREGFDLFSDVYLDRDGSGSFEDSEKVSRAERQNSVRLLDTQGREYSSQWGTVTEFEVEAAGPVRATVAVKGTLADIDGDSELDYTARLNFYAGTGMVRVFFTLANRNPTKILRDENDDAHWIMGQPGSVFFEDFSLSANLGFEGPIQLSVGDGGRDILDRVVLTAPGGIYQESSGGENWFSRIHMNHKLEIPMRFRGARTFLGEVEPYQVDRPDAWLHAADRRFGLAVAVRWFWQNFPKALTAAPDGTVRVGLFPDEWPDSHELQGGEIKTHELAFFFHTGPQGSSVAENRVATVMGAFHYPLIVRAPAESYLASGFFDDVAAYDSRSFPTYENLMQGGISGTPRNIPTDIDIHDEYGWRNWGDTPARNEYDETGGPHTGRQAASHYNHEYDHGYGMLLHGLRTTDTRPELGTDWWRMAEPALWHEADIDLYHTDGDSAAGGAFNGGKFAHTSHGVEVANASHRGSPRLVWWGTRTWPWGQGQSPESGHYNNRGMMALYYLTGNRTMLESALEIAGNVYFKVSSDVFAQIDRTSRDAGNNLQILTDAYLLSWDGKYVAAAEKILESTTPEKQWYMSEEGRAANPDRNVGGYWQPAICINAVGRWTGVMEQKTGKPYAKGRKYLERYADFVSRHMAAGPEHGFWSSWKPNGEKSGELGPWTYRVVDVVMYGHKYSDDPAIRSRCLKAARDAMEFMHRRYKSDGPRYNDSKWHTIVAGGGHEYTYYKKHGGWKK
ncbi:MAG: hypothetical protein FVQ81_07730 [Candidatus Glassbacteria bacterium]|nr:hypothetical protein [Candidatus Glassbacteria bacterium]